MFDLFFLSFDEPHAERHWAALTARCPHAQRVAGVTGILAAHRRCAELARTGMFWVVDADNEVLDCDFDHRVLRHERDLVHLWHARNPLNGLEYGWGGIKLFPRDLVRARLDMPLDMTTAFPLKVIPKVASITHFNTDAFSTWRSAFREAAKLAVSPDPDAGARLAVWTAKAHGPFASECLRGARAGRSFAIASPDDLHRINDFEWLRARFLEQHDD